MKKFIHKIRNILYRDESIKESQNKWNSLAKENAKYYVFSAKRNQSEEEFRESGKSDVQELLIDDELLQKLLRDNNSKIMLEVGCGCGRMTEFFARYFDTVYAVDISEEMIRQGKERLKNINNVHWIVTDGTNYQIEDESIDFVFSYIVFQHMPTRDVVEKNIAEIKRVLRPGGIAKIQLRGSETEKGKWYYGVAFDETEARKLFESVGLKILNSSGKGQKYFWVILEKS